VNHRLRSNSTRATAALTLGAFLLSACGGTSSKAPPAPPPRANALVVDADAKDGLDLRLSNGEKPGGAAQRAPVAPATSLDDASADKLLERAPAINAKATDKLAFALRPRTLAPPQTGTIVPGVFPPAPGAPGSLTPPVPVTADAGKALAVLRYQPEGQVSLVPQLTVTFSQPMLAVTSQDDAAKIQPVKLSPQPKGRWRWLGTKTIVFDPEVRFPQATTYQVEIPAGTTSATGNKLDKAVTFSFETPPPKLLSAWPGDGQPQRRDVPMIAFFDQEVDPAAVLATTRVTAGGGAVAIQLMTAQELAANKELQRQIDTAKANAQGERYVAFRASQPLPAASAISVQIGPKTPSKEGPNVTPEAQSFSFRTYSPLAIEEAECGWNGDCRPGMPFGIRFNNPIDAEAFDDAMVTVTPDVPGLRTMAQGNSIVLVGATAANTTYKVTARSTIPDEFGQTLGAERVFTWTVGPAVPTFYGPEGMIIADPAAKTPSLDVFTINYPQLKVTLRQVEPSDLPAFFAARSRMWDKDNPPTWPGKVVFDDKIATAPGQDKLVETHVDLAKALRGGRGHVLAMVEPFPWKERYDPPKVIAWVQATALGVSAHVDADTLVAMVTELADGKSAAGVKVELTAGGPSATTDDQGLARLPLPTSVAGDGHMLLATRGDDRALLTSYEYGLGYWTKRDPGTALRWYLTDDRRMYKPSEAFQLKGWLRLQDLRRGGDIGGLAGAITSVAYKAYDAQNNLFTEGTAPVTALGGFDLGFTLPGTPNLGGARLELTTSRGDRGTHYFQIQEFRTPEFEVSASASTGPHVIGGGGDVTVDAKYYAGGGLPGAPVSWSVTASPASFTPPNRSDYVFGEWTPWWGWHRWWDDDMGYRGGGYGGRGGGQASWSHEGKTDAVGSHVLHMDFISAKPARAMSVAAHATVMDVNRQAWTASTSLLVHPAELYVGLKAKKPYVEKGQPIELAVIGVDLDGKAAVGTAIEVKAVREETTWKKGAYVTEEKDPQACNVVAAEADGACVFQTPVGGTYKITATLRDKAGRANQTTMTVWVTGGDVVPQRDLKKEQVTIIPDKQAYAATDTAELMVQAPFFPAEALISWRRSGIVKTERVAVTSASFVTKVPLADAMIPGLTVQVDLVGAAPRTNDAGDIDLTLPKRPAYASGSITLAIPPRSRTLAVTVTPKATKVDPGEQTSFDVEVKDAAGAPVAGSEVALFVVDEAILAMTGADFADPVSTFYSGRSPDVADHYSRGWVKLARPAAAGLTGAAPGGVATATVTGGGRGGAKLAEGYADAMAAVDMPSPAAPAMAREEAADDAKPSDKAAQNAQPAKRSKQGNGNGAQPIAVRSDFNPLAAFSPTLATDAAGRATLPVKMPDNLTRYRVVAIAVAGDKQFGKGESAVTARLPLMVRPSPPRFLNFGDKFELPIVVQNQTDAAMTVDVAVRGTNLALPAGYGRRVTVPANDRVEVRVPAEAEMAGIARLQVVAVSGNAEDAAELALPVWTPATTEAFATYGVIDDAGSAAHRQPIALPGKVVTQFGGLQVSTSSTQLQALTDAMLYLVRYPYECAEQRSSRILAIAALRDVLTAFNVPDMPTPAELEKSVADDLDRLRALQNGDGGFPFWERGYESWPYLTVHVTNALVRAKAKGYAVPPPVLARAMAYLKDIESHYPHYYGPEIRRSISSYALYVRALDGDVDVAKAKEVLREAGGADKLSLESNGWLLGTMAGNAGAASDRDAIKKHLGNQVSETAGAANFTDQLQRRRPPAAAQRPPRRRASCSRP
jgi:uncharacterized protein YfaS (alpha-2-macroglobulin family)